MTNKSDTIDILIVDDEEPFRRLMKTLLDGYGYAVAQAASGEDAVGLLEGRQVRLVIADMEMPGMSGSSLLSHIKAQYPNVPVLIVTGTADINAAVECIKAGAEDYILKPVDAAEINETVQKLLTQAAAREEITQVQQPPSPRMVYQDYVEGYRIVSKLGAGTRGIVFLAEKEVDNRICRFALKLLKTDCFSDDESERAVKRFFNEARAIAEINHPNVVKIVESNPGAVEGIPYIVMEYAPGTSLRQYRRRPDQPDRRQKVMIIREIANALRAIHEKKIIHRDIKPDNIIIGDDLTVKITDFGIAHLPYSDLTGTYDLLGTPKYLSPESYTTAKIDHRSDIFSLGVIAYELLVGRHPFHAHSVPTLEHRIRVDLPEEPEKIIPDFPLALQAILAKMLRKRPRHRYQSAAELVADIDDYLGSDSDAAIPLKSYTSAMIQQDWN